MSISPVETTESKRISIYGSGLAACWLASVFYEGVNITPLVYAAEAGEKGHVSVRLVDEAGNFTGQSIELLGHVTIETDIPVEASNPAQARADLLRVLPERLYARVTVLHSNNHFYTSVSHDVVRGYVPTYREGAR
jgi:hypothetical protein